MAIANDHITADVVEISEFIDIAQRYAVQGVPKTVINDRVEFTGALPEPRFVQQVVRANDRRNIGRGYSEAGIQTFERRTLHG